MTMLKNMLPATTALPAEVEVSKAFAKAASAPVRGR